MVLDKLGDSLKETINKITKAIFVDEKLLNELVKDIQRALLQSDTNVQLVFDLSKKIKERAKEPSSPGITKREQLLTIVYEELTNFLGKEPYEIKINKKPTQIMLVGLFGSGKCVSPNTKIPLYNGEIKTIEEIYNNASGKKIIVPEKEGHRIELEKPLLVHSLDKNNLKTVVGKATAIWKLKAGSPLLKVYLDNGQDHFIEVTPEHPFFVLDKGRVKKIRADQLNKRDAIAVPYHLNKSSQEITLWNELLGQPNFVLYDPTLAGKVLLSVKNKYGNLKEAYNVLKLRNNYCHLTAMLKRGFVPFDLIPKLKLKYHPAKIRLKERKTQKYIESPTKLTSELAEFLGYVAGDGYINPKYVEIVNQDNEILNRVQELVRKLFHIESVRKKEKRSASLYTIRICSMSLVNILNKVFGLPIGAKKEKLGIPTLVLKADKEIIKAYVRAYMDCDGSFALDRRSAEVTSRSELHLRQLQTVWLYFGICSTLSKKRINDVYYTRLSLSGRSCERYAREFGSIIKYKNERLKEQIAITENQGDGKKDMVDVGSRLFELRESYGITINKIQEVVNSYGNYERTGLISKNSLKQVISRIEYLADKKVYFDFTKLLHELSNHKLNYYQIKNKFKLSRQYLNALTGELLRRNYLAYHGSELSTTELGKRRLNKLSKIPKSELLLALKNLANSDLSWIQINKIEKTKEYDWVYDFTVEEHHNFVANNIIVHNTTTAGKLAKFYKKRGYKVAVMQTDTWRPAAYDQLQQLAATVGVDFLGIKKEKDPVNIYHAFEKKLPEYDLVLVDTAGRDALSDELISELTNINAAVMPDERLLVISGDIGQAAQKQAQAFHDTCSVTGVIVTKLEGTAKGGGALSACAVTKAPIAFIGVGEKIDDLEAFYPQRFVGRLLGMGDLQSLLEKAKEVIPEEKAQDLQDRFLKGDFNLVDLYEQMKTMRKMGSFSKIMEMIPGMGSLQLPKEMLDVQEGKLDKWKIAMDSMTKEELENPDVIGADRMDRIAAGSGVSMSIVRELIKQYRQSKKMVKMFKGEKDMNKLMKKMQGKMPKGMM